MRPDESDAVIRKIAEADAVIFGTPVYWWGMSAQLKMVVDKFYSQDSQFKTMKKKIGVVVTGANGLDNQMCIRDRISPAADAPAPQSFPQRCGVLPE